MIQHKKTIYDSRFFDLFHYLGRLYIFLFRWKIVNPVPPVKKAVVIAAPHTSNWDFPIFMSFAAVTRLRATYFGKHSLFDIPIFGRLFYYLGGVPVERGTPKASRLVDQAVDLFNGSDSLYFGIAPEGTRTNVGKWKTGFYRIALKADVPIIFAYLDVASREVGLHKDLFYPTGDMEKDMAFIMNFYAGKKGIKPENQFQRVSH